MHVQAAETRKIEDGLRQQESVGDDDHDVRRECGNRVVNACLAQRRRLQDGQAERERALLDRTRGEALAAPAAAIGLRADGNETMMR